MKKFLFFILILIGLTSCEPQVTYYNDNTKQTLNIEELEKVIVNSDTTYNRKVFEMGNSIYIFKNNQLEYKINKDADGFLIFCAIIGGISSILLILVVIVGFITWLED